MTGTGPSNISANIWRLVKVEKFLSPESFDPIRIIDSPQRLTTVEREGTAEPQWAYLRRAPKLVDQSLDFLKTPNTVLTYNLTFRRRLFDFTAAGDNPDFPGEWNLALAYAIANELSPPNVRLYEMPVYAPLGAKPRAYACKRPTALLKHGESVEAPEEQCAELVRRDPYNFMGEEDYKKCDGDLEKLEALSEKEGGKRDEKLEVVRKKKAAEKKAKAKAARDKLLGKK